MKDTKNCVGCRNNFYNGNNNLGVSVCWSLADAKMKTRYVIANNVPTYQENFRKVKKLNCYHCVGYSYIDDISKYPRKPK